MQDLGIKTCRGRRHRYQTLLNLLIYKGSFGNYVRVTDSMSPILMSPESTKARLIRRHQPFEFFKPVLDDVDLHPSSQLRLHHQEALTIGCHVVPHREP